MLLILDNGKLAVTKDGPALRIEHPDGGTRHVVLDRITRVACYGNQLVSCDVWRALAGHGIPAVLFPARGKGGPAFAGAGLEASVELRKAQYKTYADPSAKAVAARRLLRMKFGGYLKLIDDIVLKNGDGGMFETDIRQIEIAAEKARDTIRRSSDALDAVVESSSLMGHEGVAAGAWFDFLARILPKKWRFSGRNRRPPLDPVNALMSLGYTIVLGDALRAVHSEGVDPGIGMLHEIRPGRPSFALDILEPLRPCADALALGMLGILAPHDFSYGKENGCRLNSAAKKTYYAEWRRARNSWPWHLLSDSEEEMGRGMPEIMNFSDTVFGPENLDYCCIWILKNVTRLLQKNEKGS